MKIFNNFCLSTAFQNNQIAQVIKQIALSGAGMADYGQRLVQFYATLNADKNAVFQISRIQSGKRRIFHVCNFAQPAAADFIIGNCFIQRQNRNAFRQMIMFMLPKAVFKTNLISLKRQVLFAAAVFSVMMTATAGTFVRGRRFRPNKIIRVQNPGLGIFPVFHFCPRNAQTPENISAFFTQSTEPGDIFPEKFFILQQSRHYFSLTKSA